MIRSVESTVRKENVVLVFPFLERKRKEESEKITLKKDSENWNNVVKYIQANKSLGLEKIGLQLNRKYTISPALKKELANIIKTEEDVLANLIYGVGFWKVNSN